MYKQDLLILIIPSIMFPYCFIPSATEDYRGRGFVVGWD